MTIHKLTTHGARRTICCLKVPPIVEVKPTATTWDDGDGVTGVCTECHAPRREQPTAQPTALQRFNAMANLPHSGPTIVGDAIVNRDGTISLKLTLMPGDGKLRLVPR